MNVVIVGWYGTETLGDCAILAGIIKVLGMVNSQSRVFIGSLYPILSQRTLLEERQVFFDLAPKVLIDYFEVKDNDVLYKTIEQADLILMGGGPICDIKELCIIRKAFHKAREIGIPRLIMGCGLDPLTRKESIDEAREILELSSGVSFRDYNSIQLAYQLLDYDARKIDMLGDPALISIEQYKKTAEKSTRDYFAVHFWNAPEMDDEKKNKGIHDYMSLLRMALNEFERVVLIPMSTFFVGGDDRLLYSQLQLIINDKRIIVCHRPMSLYDLYGMYAEAKACFAVRHHAALMQTILNGNNYIYDYTDPVKGKTTGFIKLLKNNEFYKDRYYSIFSSNIFDPRAVLDVLNKNKKYEYHFSNTCEKYYGWITQYL